MKKQWMISSIVTILIWGAGIYGFFFIKDYVPDQLPASPEVAASETVDPEEGPETKELKEIIHDTQKLVVHLEVDNASLGSGFLYNDKGDVVTNAHVVAGGTEVNVKTADSREFAGTVIGISEETDVALVRVEGLKGTEPLPVKKEEVAEVGDEVLALGSPFGLQNTVTEGIISGINRDFDLAPYHYEDVYQISAPIAPGNSGGPLVDSKTGEVLGINSAGAGQGDVGFSIPMVNVISLIEGWSASPMAALPQAAESSQEQAVPDSEYTDSELAEYVVRYFYESLNYQDYVTAYSLLGSSWQAGTSYDHFRDGYLRTESVVIDDLIVNDEEQLTVTAIISAQERREGQSVPAKYKTTYVAGYENGQMKLLSGTGEKIE